MSIKKKDIIGQVLRLMIILVLMFFIVFPFLVALSNTFKTEGELNSITPSLIPSALTLDNITELFTQSQFPLGMRNSAFVAVITMFFSLLIAIPSAYVIARGSRRLAPITQGWVVVSQMIPMITLTVPVYIILKNMKLSNTFPGLILVYVIWSIPTTLWLLKGFISGFPRELEEAATIDGCGNFGILTKILLPNILPGVMTAGIFAFIGAWNEFFFALCFMKSPEKITLALTIQQYIGLSGQSRDGMVAAAALFSSLPGILLFSFFQRYYVSGLTEGALK